MDRTRPRRAQALRWKLQVLLHLRDSRRFNVGNGQCWFHALLDGRGSSVFQNAQRNAPAEPVGSHPSCPRGAVDKACPLFLRAEHGKKNCSPGNCQFWHRCFVDRFSLCFVLPLRMCRIEMRRPEELSLQGRVLSTPKPSPASNANCKTPRIGESSPEVDEGEGLSNG